MGSRQPRSTELDPRTLRVEFVDAADRIATWGDVIEGWCRDTGFQDRFTAVIAEAPWPGVFWETPGLVRGGLAHSFEMVLIDSPALPARPADPSAFARQMSEGARAGARTATFDNLSGDATLIVPLPTDQPEHCGHIAAFCRGGGAAPTRALWQSVGQAIGERLNDQPLWVSTSGLGVPWLHVRLDRRPKYYQHGPYRAFRRGT